MFSQKNLNKLHDLPKWKRGLVYAFVNECVTGKTPDGLAVTSKSLTINEIFEVIDKYDPEKSVLSDGGFTNVGKQQ